jgi:NADH-quinone oxidoreductase subunit I
MYGLGIVKGMAVTFKHMIETYLDDIRWIGRGGRYWNPDALEVRQNILGSRGAVTINYPEEKLPVPERFRFVPFLVTDDPPPGQAWGHDWCTSCGICAKVCPPQCIWIERGKQPNGRPKPEPEQFWIDIDICMNCGFCAEFCPFDAIKMDHDYELASYDRSAAHIHDKARLSKPLSYWREIAPRKAAAEAAAREMAEASKGKRRSKDDGADQPTLPEEHLQQLYYRGSGY